MTRTQIEYPAALMIDCDFDEQKIYTNQDLLNAYWRSRLAYDECAAKHKSLVNYLLLTSGKQ